MGAGSSRVYGPSSPVGELPEKLLYTRHDNEFLNALNYLRNGGIINEQVDTDWERDLLSALGGTMYQNNYNLPVNQIQRLIAAGVSPFAATQMLANGNSESVPSVSSHEEQYEQKNADLFISAFNSAIGFARSMSSIVGSSIDQKFALNSFNDRLSALHWGSIKTNQQAFGESQKAMSLAFINALHDYSLKRGDPKNYIYPESGKPFIKSSFGGPWSFDIDEDTFGIFSPYLGTQLNKTKIRELDYKIDNILPQILDKYNVSNDMQHYILDGLNALPADIRNYIMMGLTIYSQFK